MRGFHQKIRHHFCPNSSCKDKYFAFKKTFNRLYNDWKQYNDYLSCGNTEAAESLNKSSVYGHLFDKDIHLLKVQFDAGFTASDIQRDLRNPCLNCGGDIPDDLKITAKFCGDRCKDEYHNKRRKKDN